MIHFSNHAVDRYRERVKPGMSRNHVKHELLRLARMGTITTDPPKWWITELHEANRYVEVTDGVAFALKPVHDGFLAVTCVIRCGDVRLHRPPKRKRIKRRVERRSGRTGGGRPRHTEADAA